MTDQELLTLLKEQPEEGLEELMNKYMSLAYTICASRLQSSAVTEDIEECVSDIFYEMYKTRSRIDLEKGSIKSYFSTVANRKAIDKFRQVTGQTDQVLSIDDINLDNIPLSGEAVENILISREARKELIHQILSLGTPDSEIFVRKYFLDQSTKQIAREIHVKENTVDKKVSRGLVKLRKLMAVSMATVAVAAAVVFAVGPENVMAAVQKMFNFIPGYGIIQEDSKEDTGIRYIISEPVSAETDNASLRLNNAVANEETITVMFELVREGISEEDIKKEKEKFMDEHMWPKVRFYTQDQMYDKFAGSFSSSGINDHYTLSYNVGDPGEINGDTEYKLEYPQYGLSVAFKLKERETFSSLEEIGPTDCHNNISITAVAEKNGEKMDVELYSINANDYQKDVEAVYVYSFSKDITAYKGDDLHLITDGGRKEYTKPASYESPNTKFTFDTDPDDKNFILKIPYILVQSREENDVKLPVPKPGEKVKLNQKVRFDGCSMIITEVENVSKKSFGEDSGGISEENSLKLTFEYENENDNKVLMRTNFVKTDRFGKWLGGGYSVEEDDDGILNACWIFLEEDERKKDSIMLKILNPVYYLTDSYDLKLDF